MVERAAWHGPCSTGAEMSPKLAAIAISLGLFFGVANARADCLAAPSECYCVGAAAVVEGVVEELLQDGISVRVDTVAVSPARASTAPAVGSSIVVAQNDFWGALPEVGERILAPYDGEGQLVPPAHIELEGGNVSCDGYTRSAAHTANLMTLDTASCNAAVEQEFGKYECDDTEDMSCALGTGSPSGWYPFGVLLGALLSSVRRRRSLSCR